MLNSDSDNLGDCASGAGLKGVNLAGIQWNFAQSDCKSCWTPTPKSLKRRGLGGYVDAKIGFRGLHLRDRAQVNLLQI